MNYKVSVTSLYIVTIKTEKELTEEFEKELLEAVPFFTCIQDLMSDEDRKEQGFSIHEIDYAEHAGIEVQEDAWL